MQSQNQNELPKEVADILIKIVIQARTARGLSITEASDRLGTSAFRLKEIEEGRVGMTNQLAMAMCELYGGVRSDKLFSILWNWSSIENAIKYKTERRKHLSIVGSDPKPWERADYSSCL